MMFEYNKYKKCEYKEKKNSIYFHVDIKKSSENNNEKYIINTEEWLYT